MANTAHEQMFKKMITIGRLLLKEFKGHGIQEVSGAISDIATPPTLFMRVNEMDFSLGFVRYETWDKIKTKVAKLLKCDGVCCVCFEKKDTFFCQTCCEVTCEECRIILCDKDDLKCPCCRQCLYCPIYKEKQEKCLCDKCY